MKKRFSLNAFMHNRTAVIIFSIIAAVFVWGSVIYGSSNDEKRVLHVQVPVSLGTYAEQLGLCILNEGTADVQVSVSGPFSVVSQLSAEDVRVEVDTSVINNAGKYSVEVKAYKNSLDKNFTIGDCFPRTVAVECDYWEKNIAYKVEVDLNNTTVSDSKEFLLGDAVVDTSVFPDGNVSLEGPRSVISKIHTIVARIKEPKKISKTETFVAELVALDEAKKELDISACKFTNLEFASVNVTVPVWVSRTVNFTYDVVNAPQGLAGTGNLVTVNPPSIVIVGPQEDVDAFANSVTHLGTLDFDNISENALTKEVALNVPTSVKVLDNTNLVTMSVNVENYTAKEFTINIGTLEKNVEVKGVPTGTTVNVPTQTITFTVLGKKSELNKLQPSDFSGFVQVSGGEIQGMKRHSLRIRIKNRDTMWVYYGTNVSGIDVYVTLS